MKGEKGDVGLPGAQGPSVSLSVVFSEHNNPAMVLQLLILNNTSYS